MKFPRFTCPTKRSRKYTQASQLVLVIRTSTQVPFHVRRMVAPLLGLSVKDIRIIKPRIGGGFGAKQEMLIEDIVGHLTLVTGHPVRLELNRQEEFMSSRTRHPQTITYKTGVNDDGVLVSQSMRLIGNSGAYGTHALTVQQVSGLRGLSSAARSISLMARRKRGSGSFPVFSR